MQTLLQRLESLTAPSREVSDELLLSWGWERNWPDTVDEVWVSPVKVGPLEAQQVYDAAERPHPTASTDDALLGKPDGCNMDHQYIHSKGTWLVDIWFSFQPKSAYAYNASLPLALCNAIVKARGGV